MKEYVSKESKISASNIDYNYLDFQIHKIVENMIVFAELDAYVQGREDVIKEVLAYIETGIQCTGHSDPYATGFSNALIWLRSCITKEEPEFLEMEKEK